MATVDLITIFSQIRNCILRSVRSGGKDQGKAQKVPALWSKGMARGNAPRTTSYSEGHLPLGSKRIN